MMMGTGGVRVSSEFEARFTLRHLMPLRARCTVGPHSRTVQEDPVGQSILP